MIKFRKIVMAILVLFTQLFMGEECKCQNLIRDGDFEKMTRCPKGPRGKATGYETLSYLKHWYPLNSWEADYYNTCQRFPADTDKNVNMLDFREPYSGAGYIGIKATTFGSRGRFDNCGSYAMTKLKLPLEQGKKYHVEFYAILNWESTIAVANLGIFLSRDSIPKSKGISERFKINGNTVEPQFENNAILDDTANWTKVEGDFIASGGEQFLVIGNFRNNENLKWVYMDPEKKNWKHRSDGWSYYFIDKMMLYPVANENMENQLLSGQTVALQQVLFEIDAYTIQPSFLEELNQLYLVMQQQPAMIIEVSGHSDDTGQSEYNELLSLNRAKAIQAYLAGKGIAIARIKLKGHGSSLPKGNNATEEGRKSNRRVEVRVL